MFAALKEMMGEACVELDLPPGTTVAQMKHTLAERYPSVREVLARTQVALNQEFAAPEAVVPEGAELACIPPVSGG